MQNRFQSSVPFVEDSIDILLKLKQPQAALDYLQQLSAQTEYEFLLPPDELRAKVYLALGQPEQAQKATQQASTYYEQQIERFALGDYSYADFARFLMSNAKYHEALLANAKAIALHSDCYDYYLMWACIYAQMKDKSHTLETLSKAKQIGSTVEQQYNSLERGRIYELLGDYMMAEREYQKEEERPWLLRDYLVSLYQKTGQPEKIQAVEQELRQRAEFDERVSEEMLAELLG